MFAARVAVASALTFGVVLWWGGRGVEPSPGTAHAGAFARGVDTGSFETIARDPAVRDDEVAAATPAEDGSEQASEANFERYVDDKYRFLLETAGGTARGAQDLRAALLDRERIAVGINTARQSTDEDERRSLPERREQLAAAERSIGRLLPAADLAAFDALKESHIEQFQLDDYADGISHVAPLADADRRSILYSKLSSRQRFRQALEQSGLMQGGVPPADRDRAVAQLARALAESRDSFLQEARQYLHDDEQYTLLRNYENGEYRAELEKLRRMAASGGTGLGG
jgi:hypothetical protein